MSRRESKCGSKRAYPSRAAAQTAARAHRFARMSSYKCPFCGSWHVGHTARKTRTRVSR